MTRFRSAALAVLLLAATPSLALAHKGVIHTGCPTGQVFTAGAVSVTGAYVRATLKGAQSAGGYLTLSNSGSSPDIFMGASSQAAHDIAIHSMNMNGDVMEMAPVPDGLEIPPGGSVSLDPMGYHLMLTGMEQPFVEGQCVEMTLHFAHARDLPIQLNIGGYGQSTPPSGDAKPASEAPKDMGSMDMGGMDM